MRLDGHDARNMTSAVRFSGAHGCFALLSRSRTTRVWSKVSISKELCGVFCRRSIKSRLHIALLSAQTLMCVSVWQPVTAQTSNTPAIEARTALTAEQVVNNLVRRNLERAQALAAYQGTRIYRLEYHGFRGLEAP
jgi:hypothetical protein